MKYLIILTILLSSCSNKHSNIESYREYIVEEKKSEGDLFELKIYRKLTLRKGNDFKYIYVTEFTNNKYQLGDTIK